MSDTNRPSEDDGYIQDELLDDRVEQRNFKGLPIVDLEDLELEDLVSLVYSPPDNLVSRTQPRKCEVNASFIIDTRHLKGPNDWKADDLDMYDNTGKPHLGYFLISSDNTATFLDKKKPTKPLDVPGKIVKDSRTYWVHQKHKDFKRRALELKDEDNKRLPFVLLEYRFDGKEHSITSEPHKNAKQGKGEFLRTKPSVIKMLKRRVESRSSVSEVYDQAFEDAGAIVNF